MLDEPFDILFDEGTIRDKVREMADRISRDYAGRELLLISILKGAAIFTADLARSLTVPVEIDFVSVSSYGDAAVASETVTLEKDIRADIRGRDVLLVDGIVDRGRTLALLLEHCRERRPASLRVAVLLDKPGRRTTPVPIDYRGFSIPDRFVVGYGMDRGQKYRNLPFIAALSPENS